MLWKFELCRKLWVSWGIIARIGIIAYIQMLQLFCEILSFVGNCEFIEALLPVLELLPIFKCGNYFFCEITSFVGNCEFIEAPPFWSPAVCCSHPAWARGASHSIKSFTVVYSRLQHRLWKWLYGIRRVHRQQCHGPPPIQSAGKWMKFSSLNSTLY